MKLYFLFLTSLLFLGGCTTSSQEDRALKALMIDYKSSFENPEIINEIHEGHFPYVFCVQIEILYQKFYEQKEELDEALIKENCSRFTDMHERYYTQHLKEKEAYDVEDSKVKANIRDAVEYLHEVLRKGLIEAAEKQK